jgi:hypothetical protein
VEVDDKFGKVRIVVDGSPKEPNPLKRPRNKQKIAKPV